MLTKERIWQDSGPSPYVKWCPSPPPRTATFRTAEAWEAVPRFAGALMTTGGLGPLGLMMSSRRGQGNAVRNRWRMWEAPSANHSKVVCYLYYTIYVQSKYSVRLESKRELLVLSYLLMSSYTYPKWLKEPVAKRCSGSEVLSAACIMFLWLDLKMLQVSKKKWYDWRVQAISRLKAEIDLPCQTMFAPWSVSYAAPLYWFTKISQASNCVSPVKTNTKAKKALLTRSNLINGIAQKCHRHKHTDS